LPPLDQLVQRRCVRVGIFDHHLSVRRTNNPRYDG
jgi:hypothetical protein